MKAHYTIFALALFGTATWANAQKNGADPVGTIVYSLPSTTITLEVEAERESFHAGPYAKFSEKYLGIPAQQEDKVSYELTNIKMTPYVEADLSKRYVLAVNKPIEATFLRLSNEGLVSLSDGDFGKASEWRFPSTAKADFSDKGISSNLTSTQTTLYRNVKSESEYNKIGIQQNLVVEKSLEKKAAETANMIFALREKRVQIVTGDTDATYSGEAMAAAIEEIDKLENEYLSMFVGYSDCQVQKMTFDVVPEADRENQIYVAFRISDAQGLVSADNLSGKPVVLEIDCPEIAQVSGGASNKGPYAFYRTPAVCTVGIKNGTQTILKTRMPVYQLGQTCSFPIATSLK